MLLSEARRDACATSAPQLPLRRESPELKIVCLCHLGLISPEQPWASLVRRSDIVPGRRVLRLVDRPDERRQLGRQGGRLWLVSVRGPPNASSRPPVSAGRRQSPRPPSRTAPLFVCCAASRPAPAVVEAATKAWSMNALLSGVSPKPGGGRRSLVPGTRLDCARTPSAQNRSTDAASATSSFLTAAP